MIYKKPSRPIETKGPDSVVPLYFTGKLHEALPLCRLDLPQRNIPYSISFLPVHFFMDNGMNRPPLHTPARFRAETPRPVGSTVTAASHPPAAL